MSKNDIRVWNRSLLLAHDGDLLEFDSRLPDGKVLVTLRELQVDDWSETQIILNNEQIQALRHWLREKK